MKCSIPNKSGWVSFNTHLKWVCLSAICCLKIRKMLFQSWNLYAETVFCQFYLKFLSFISEQSGFMSNSVEAFRKQLKMGPKIHPLVGINLLRKIIPDSMCSPQILLQIVFHHFTSIITVLSMKSHKILSFSI